MGELQQQFASGVGAFFGSGAVQLALRVILAYILAVWLASAYWAYRDMRSRTDNLTLPYLAAALVILFTPLLFPLGLVVYRIVRPGERVADRRERALSESVLLAEAGEIEQCAGCHRIVQADWVTCPTCRTELRERCGECNRLVEFDWVACAYCGNDLRRLAAPMDGRRRDREPVPVMDESAKQAPAWTPGSSPTMALATGSDRRRGAKDK